MSAVSRGPMAMVTNTFATVVKVKATMKAVNMIAQHRPANHITRGDCHTVRHSDGPRKIVNAMIKLRALKKLRQKVTSKLAAASRWRVTTPAMLQSKVTTIIRTTARL